MFWRGIIVGVALGVWVASLALWALWTEDDRNPPCPATTCCGGCDQHGHPHPPPVNIPWAPQGPLRYYCGLSDHGGSFVWDHGGGFVWDHGAGYVWDHGGSFPWDHGGAFVWDQGGGYVWDHGGAFVWDHGGGFVWDEDHADDVAPAPESPVVPIPSAAELGRDRNPFEFRCHAGAGGMNDVSVIQEGRKVSIVMPNGNELFQCAVGDEGQAVIEPRVDPLPAEHSSERAYCMVVDGNPFEFIDPDWAP